MIARLLVWAITALAVALMIAGVVGVAAVLRYHYSSSFGYLAFSAIVLGFIVLTWVKP